MKTMWGKIIGIVVICIVLIAGLFAFQASRRQAGADPFLELLFFTQVKRLYPNLNVEVSNNGNQTVLYLNESRSLYIQASPGEPVLYCISRGEGKEQHTPIYSVTGESQILEKLKNPECGN